jgi:hypothetical protein
VGNFAGNWYSRDAKFIDECKASNGGGLITLKQWTLSENVEKQSILGGTIVDGPGCWKFAQWTSWAPYVAKMGVGMLHDAGLITVDDVAGDINEQEVQVETASIELIEETD